MVQRVREQPTIQIGRRVIGEGRPAFIVAEAGVNHLGRRDLAVNMVKAAAAAGADAIKFQTCQVDEFLPRSNADYAEYRRTALSVKDYQAIATAAQRARILWFSTPLDEPSADMLDRLGVPMFKVASCDLTHRPLLGHLAAKGKPIILSTGMATWPEVRQAVRVLRESGARQLAVLHCVSQYPAEPQYVHLHAMEFMRRRLRVPVGFSDHTIGAAIPCAAVALGAVIIEKHITLDHTLPGDDHRFSATPRELREMITSIRRVEQALGVVRKRPAPVEMGIRDRLRRIIVAAKPLPVGLVVARSSVVFQRPDPKQHDTNQTLSAWAWPRVEGRCLKASVAAGAAFGREHVEDEK